MKVLFHGSGVTSCEVLGPVLSDEDWATLQQQVTRLLEARGKREAAQYLRSVPFKFCHGTNRFGDEFCVLNARLEIDDYIAFEQRTATRPQGSVNPFAQIAAVFSELDKPVRIIGIDPAVNAGPAPVHAPELQITSETVERALADAEHLLRSSGGPSSAIDRIHTAFHGYLEAVCRHASITIGDDESITALFGKLRTHHPALQATGPRPEDVQRVVRAFAQIVDALNPIRNQASNAHPNDAVLGAPEAMLLLNGTRTLLHYLDAKLS